MPKQVNTLPLKNDNFLVTNAHNQQTMIDIREVSMVFNMANEQLNSIKEYVIALAKRELSFKE
ncbi:MAG: hypothetical protein RSB04_10970, partial [Gordonibacter sp.]|uniref:hypothetical protein n=1 Tax=Gordonibacter sp. TaxID=1968902 RepID=UPI002FCB8A93